MFFSHLEEGTLWGNLSAAFSYPVKLLPNYPWKCMMKGPGQSMQVTRETAGRYRNAGTETVRACRLFSPRGILKLNWVRSG